MPMADVNKVLEIAKAELGYLEKKTNASLDDKAANAGSGNYTKYWRDLAPGYQGQSWCNAWIDWIHQKAYGEKEAKKLLCTPGGWSYYTPTSASYFKSKGQWYTKSPQVGDIIYFKNSQRICHVGIVYKVDSAYVYTYEGNTSGGSGVVANGGGVFAKKYSLSNSRIAGYGRPKYDNTSSTPTTNTNTISTARTNPSANYKVKITTATLNVRKGAGTGYGKNGTVKINEIYTIIEEKDGWGKLKSGAGWISLKYTKRI